MIELSNVIVTDALLIPACPCLYISSCRLVTRAYESVDKPRTNKIESMIFDFPEPFRPVIALNYGSKPAITVLFAYDLNPSKIISLMCIFLVK